MLSVSSVKCYVIRESHLKFSIVSIHSVQGLDSQMIASPELHILYGPSDLHLMSLFPFALSSSLCSECDLSVYHEVGCLWLILFYCPWKNLANNSWSCRMYLWCIKKQYTLLPSPFSKAFLCGAECQEFQIILYLRKNQLLIQQRMHLLFKFAVVYISYVKAAELCQFSVFNLQYPVVVSKMTHGTQAEIHSAISTLKTKGLILIKTIEYDKQNIWTYNMKTFL